MLPNQTEMTTNVTGIMKGSIPRLGIPGVISTGWGYILNALKVDGTLGLLIYVVVVIGIVVGLTIWRRRRMDLDDPNHSTDLFFASIFVVLNTPMLLSAVTRMDPANLYTLPTFDVGPIPFMLNFLVSLLVSASAWVMLGFLRKWIKKQEYIPISSPLSRAILATLLPTLFVFASQIPLGNPGGWLYRLIVLGILFGAFSVIIAFEDSDHKVQLVGPKKWYVIITIQVIIILCIFGVAGTIATYMQPSVISIPDHNMFWSWEVDFDALGYPEHAFYERFRIGLVLMSLATIIYLTIVVGSHLVMTVHKRTSEIEA